MCYRRIMKLEDFYIPRTPNELRVYVDSNYNSINNDEDLKKLARIRKEPFKTFREELMPFAKFCSWKYSNRNDILCSLVPGSGGQDGKIKFANIPDEHLVEITWPIDGKQASIDAKNLNSRGYSDSKVWNDEFLFNVTDRTLEGARKKSIKDYSSRGGSSLLIILSAHPWFDLNNPKHHKVVEKLIMDLQGYEYKIENVYLNLFPEDEFLIVKGT